MDIESDDSERWEDFFGSTTELAPSLLGIYDTLTSALDVSSGASSNASAVASVQFNGFDERWEFLQRRRQELHGVSGSHPRDTELSGDSCCSDKESSSINSHNPIPNFTSHTGNNSTSLQKSFRRLRILSPNVQRLITHLDVQPTDTLSTSDAVEAIRNAVPHNSSSLVPPAQRYIRKPLSGGTHAPVAQHKPKLSHIPLSHNTGKLTESGSDLVQTFSSSSDQLDGVGAPTPSDRVRRKHFGESSPYSADVEKTPTNTGGVFNFERKSYESIKLIEMEQLATTRQLLNNGTPATPKSPKVAAPLYTNESPVNNAREPPAAMPMSSVNIVEAFNYTLIGALDAGNDVGNGDGASQICEAVNKTLISQPLARSVCVTATNAVARPPATYARSKSLGVKANTLGGTVPLKLPTAEQLEDLEEASRISAESLDRLTDIKSKFSPKESRKIRSLVLPDIAKLKHRPLSSASICSTSSTSSSGSDQLNGSKLLTSYQASAESLADQSENESLDAHAGMSVFQRACMEIVDSERSYVADLGQVIRGYLLDWKERACLSYKDLSVLFANIEEIYDFNGTLLKQLINSGMDPQKIAKCFIDLRENFHVYTTYCTSYPAAISLLTRLLQATHTNALLISTQKLLQQTLPLGSYLLKPVQRILKYHLLLDNLRKHCDVKEVVQAYEIMRQVARNIDQVKRKLEQQSRVKELSGILDGWLGPELTVLGELRQEGLLMEHSKPRVVFLFATMLIITKSKEDNRLQFKSYIHQNNLMLSEHLPGEPTSFYVIPYDEPRNQIKLTAKNRDQKRLWAQHIKGVILEKFDNIPNRAKELVYKLGDEEAWHISNDGERYMQNQNRRAANRKPDKNSWKWSLHSSTSTPVYLERRNQYRRSEVRNRSLKFKHKTIANTSSFDCFNEMSEAAKAALSAVNQSVGAAKSIDNSQLPALASPNSNEDLEAPKNGQIEQAEKAGVCILLHQHTGSATLLRTTKSSLPLFGNKTLKERSKSVPRISMPVDEFERRPLHGSNNSFDDISSSKTKSKIPLVEVKQYNHKTMPKRIATLKKLRKDTSKKETSTFYMDLSDFEPMPMEALKIVESTDELYKPPEGNKHQVYMEPAVEATEQEIANETENDEHLAFEQRDAQIILDLLKEHKEFERIYKKQPRKRSNPGEQGICFSPTSPESHNSGRLLMEDESVAVLPPRAPSHSPPPLDADTESRKQGIVPDKDDDGEPIYESLLRNVHVPYSFSPVFARSKSAQSYKAREKKTVQKPRPESDYVTLVYSPQGDLQQVGDDMMILSSVGKDMARDSVTSRHSSASSSSTSTLKRDSQSTVSHMERLSPIECINSNLNDQAISFSSDTHTAGLLCSRPIPKMSMNRLISGQATQATFRTSETSLLPRPRKSLDSISLPFARSSRPPERHVSDVTEMCRHSILHRQGSEAVGERMAHLDYADPRTLFGAVITANSATNSEASLQRDSVFSLTSSSDSMCESGRQRSNTSRVHHSSSFEYEADVEARLEADFRDSAIYSDDNEKRLDLTPPIMSPTRITADISSSTSCMAIPPPQVPAKPLRTSLLPFQQMSAFNEGTTDELLSHMSRSLSARSWVLQQIDNFNK